MRPQLLEDIAESYQQHREGNPFLEARPQLQEDFYESSTDLSEVYD